MKVAYLINQYPRPSHSFIRREIEGLEAQGVEVQRCSIRPPEGALPDARDVAERGRTRSLLGAGPLALAGGVLAAAARRPLRALRAVGLAARLGWRSERGVLRHLAYLAEAALLVRWLEASQATHLHAHFGTNSATVALLCRALGGPPWSFTAHGPEEFDGPGPLGLGPKIEAADFVVGISSFGRSQLRRHCETRQWGKLHVVRCGLDAAFLDAPQAPITSRPRLVCVGRLCPDKGQIVLIDAIAALVREGRDVELELVGDGPSRPELEAAIEAHHLEDRVRITGWASSSEVRDAIQRARALVLPSAAEGLPIVLLEALALGRPVVTTYVAGIPEIVTPGESGWLVPAGSVEALTAALRDVLAAAPAELEAMGQTGRARVLERHDARRSAAALRDLFARRQSPGVTTATARAPRRVAGAAS